VLMALIQTCLRWLMPPSNGMQSPMVPAYRSPDAAPFAATQPLHSLAPIHAPPPDT